MKRQDLLTTPPWGPGIHSGLQAFNSIQGDKDYYTQSQK